MSNVSVYERRELSIRKQSRISNVWIIIIFKPYSPQKTIFPSVQNVNKIPIFICHLLVRLNIAVALVISKKLLPKAEHYKKQISVVVTNSRSRLLLCQSKKGWLNAKKPFSKTALFFSSFPTFLNHLVFLNYRSKSEKTFDSPYTCDMKKNS